MNKLCIILIGLSFGGCGTMDYEETKPVSNAAVPTTPVYEVKVDPSNPIPILKENSRSVEVPDAFYQRELKARTFEATLLGGGLGLLFYFWMKPSAARFDQMIEKLFTTKRDRARYDKKISQLKEEYSKFSRARGRLFSTRDAVKAGLVGGSCGFLVSYLASNYVPTMKIPALPPPTNTSFKTVSGEDMNRVLTQNDPFLKSKH